VGGDGGRGVGVTVGMVAVTAAGRAAAGHLAAVWTDARIYEGMARDAVPAAMAECDGVVCFLATGATVRLVAPLLTGKNTDPGVVCVDEARRWAVALVGGHAGGANALARRVAAALGATAVVTTASDAAGVSALDGFGSDVGLRVEPGGDLATVGAAVLSGDPVELRGEETWPLPPLPPSVVRSASPAGQPPVREVGRPAIVVTDRTVDVGSPAVVYRPPSLVVGVGASRGAAADEVAELLARALGGAGLAARSIRWFATAEVKRDEPGIVEVARRHGVPLVTYPAGALAAVDVPHPSDVVRRAVGTPSVAEAAALLGPGDAAVAGARLVVPKTVSAHATVAIARHPPRGRLALVGLGPGDRDLLSPRAAAELARASVVVGLDQYIDGVRDLIRPGATVLATGLGDEETRARTAVEQARAGHAVALVGSGDVGVYAMASPALEQADATFDVVGVPGVTAALAASSLLGAPLGHDHASISLSDLHTPWEIIERRVRAVAEADIVVAFYNPRSRTRTWQLPRALDLIATHRPPGTPVGIVTDAFRPGQRVTVTALSALDASAVADLVTMTTTVVVGSSRTRTVAGRMVTPRGYRWA
jgi:cobalt-precorrin 5A hydrolase / precorrin-3B C17-methyltransferase